MKDFIQRLQAMFNNLPNPVKIMGFVTVSTVVAQALTDFQEYPYITALLTGVNNVVLYIIASYKKEENKYIK